MARGKYAKKKTPVKRKTNYNEKSLENLKRRTPGRKDTKYISLDIAGFDDYLSRMSKYMKVTRTKYIRDLIERDLEAHRSEYEALSVLSEFDPK